MNNAPILLVEDEQHIAQGLIFNLRQEGYLVTHVENGEDALIELNRKTFALIILDRMLPDGLDGLEVCRRIRALDPQLPILMLTAMGREQDRIDGLSEGADDYLSKPFNLSELLLRVHGMLRRSAWYRTPARLERSYSFGASQIDLDSGEAKNQESHFQLTELELRMLKLFFSHEGEVLSRAYLLRAVWGMAPDTETRTLDNFIVRLRKYFEKNPARPRHFVTVRGQGYVFYKKP
ncbi:MAG: response regulator transcription factor [Desulfuromonadaceae bacterium]|nr:response regulator transcription factor [Desulfuromonadaceae bacterium]